MILLISDRRARDEDGAAEYEIVYIPMYGPDTKSIITRQASLAKALFLAKAAFGEMVLTVRPWNG